MNSTIFATSSTAGHGREFLAAFGAAFRRHVPVHVLAVATLTLALLVGAMTGNYPDFGVLRSYGFYLMVAFWVAGCGLAVISLVKLAVVDRARSPLGAFLASFRQILRDKDRLAIGLNGMAALVIFISGFSVLKGAIAILKPFSWDQRLLDIDRALHFGRLPHEWLWPLFRVPQAVYALNIAYNLWFFVLLATVFSVAITRRDSVLRQQFLISFMAIWLIGGFFVALGFSSAGPCYVDRLGLGGAYQPLMDALMTISRTHTILALSTQDVLWSGYTGATSGRIGISAFPSMHVASTVLFAIYATRRSRVAGAAMWAFAAAIMLGSVVLGWHYAVDGYVGALISVVVWKAAGRIAPRLSAQVYHAGSSSPATSTASATRMPTTTRLPSSR